MVYSNAVLPMGRELLYTQECGAPDGLPDFSKTEPTAHPRFYFPDGNVIFQVEMTLFNIHRYFLIRDSPTFKTMFSLPQPPITASNSFIEGSSPESPIFLSGITAEDFARFLTVLYPTADDKTYSDFLKLELTSLSELISLLHVSTHFDFPAIRSIALTHISSHPHLLSNPAECIVLGKACDQREWLLRAYTTLCMRDEPLSLEEGGKLGMEDVIRIGKVRGVIRYWSNFNRPKSGVEEVVESTLLD